MNNLFNHDTEHEAMGLALAREGVWTHYMYCPPSSEIFDRALGLYPCLEVHKGLAQRRRMGTGLEPKEICSSLVEMDEGEHALEFLQYIKHSTPEGYSHEEGYLEGAENVMTFLVPAFIKKMEEIKSEMWRGSSARQTLKTMISLVDDMFPFAFEGHPAGKAQPLHQPYIARRLYEIGDTELFTMIYDRMNQQTQTALVRDMTDFMCAAKANHLPLQLRLLEKVNGDKHELGPVGLSNVTLSFWKDLPALLKMLKTDGTATNYRQVFDMAIDRLSIESVYQQADAFKKSKLFPIVSGMAALLVDVRAAGLELTEKDFRETLRPIEKVATLGKRMQWVTPMGDSFATLKADMKAGFEGHTPTELFKRPLPKELAGAMSTVMDDTRWVAKARLKDQGKIFGEDLGL
jgi:hypothetical protein